MNRQNRLLPVVLCVSFWCAGAVYGQAPEKIGKMPVKFGKVTPEDFNANANAIDSSPAAIVIADFGTSEFEGNSRGWFSLLFKHSCRIKIIKKEAFEAATITIPLYISGRESEKVDGLRASTYNLEGGKVVETKLDDKSIFTNQLDKNHSEKKFSFPAVKEGSIIEYTYTQSSPFLFNLQPWSFQREYPCLWSEYQVDMPNFFQYVTLGHGYVPFDVNSTDSRRIQFHVSDNSGTEKTERFDFEDEVITHRWVIRNVPALKEEPFTTTVANYMARLEFQLSRYAFPNGYNKTIMENWASLSKELLESSEFGGDLDSHNGWMDDELPAIFKSAGKPLEKAQKIFAYVRDNFTCTSHSRLYRDKNIRTIFKDRSGSEAEINLLLTALLIHAKVDAKPVILSTRRNGLPNELYPLLSRFNYVVSQVSIDSSQFYLDASDPWLAFGRLPERCYNGYARVLDKDNPSTVSFDPDLLKENKVTFVILTTGDKGQIEGHLQSTPGYGEACEIREKMKKSSESEYLKTIQSGYSQDVAVKGLEMDSLKLPDDPLAVAYDITITPDPDAGILYFNPMLSEAMKENPFKAADRKYPVEMPYAMDKVYTLTMEIPTGYTVDEIPKSARVMYNSDEGMFEYLVVKSETNIQFRSRIKLNQANFKPEDYSSLREFFGFVVKKESEQIVFKKKKA